MSSWTLNDLWLQTLLEGNGLLRIMVYLSAVVRLRRVLIKGLRFRDLTDLLLHVRRLLADPWRTGSGFGAFKAAKAASTLPTAALQAGLGQRQTVQHGAKALLMKGAHHAEPYDTQSTHQYQKWQHVLAVL